MSAAATSPASLSSVLELLPTPCVVIDTLKMRRNCAALHAHMASVGKGLRIRHHVKTLKSTAATRFAFGVPAGVPLPTTIACDCDGGDERQEREVGYICASTIAEVAAFAADNFSDIMYAVGIEPGKVAPLLAILAKHPALHLTLITDSLDGIQRVAERFRSLLLAQQRELQRKVSVAIEINVGQNRGGIHVACSDADEERTDETDSQQQLLLATAQCILGASDIFAFAGVVSHSGHSYCFPSLSAKYAEQERRALVAAATRLRAAGIPVVLVSAGSTPTCTHIQSVEGLTECRAGVFVTADLDQSRIACDRVVTDDDIALTVLAAVVGHQSQGTDGGALVVDAGGLAMSKDISAREKGVPGYALVLGEPTLHLASVSQEHGLVKLVDGEFCAEERRWRLRTAASDEDQRRRFTAEDMHRVFERYPIGSRLRLLVHHACFTAAPHAVLYAHDPTANTVTEWSSLTQWY